MCVTVGRADLGHQEIRGVFGAPNGVRAGHLAWAPPGFGLGFWGFGVGLRGAPEKKSPFCPPT